MKNFEIFLEEYMAFREEIKPLLSKRVPNEIIGLQAEAMELEPMYFRAEDFRAWGASLYYKAKHFKIEALHKEGYAVSALSELAKAASYRELWAQESSEGLCAAIKDRKIKVAQLLKLSAP